MVARRIGLVVLVAALWVACGALFYINIDGSGTSDVPAGTPVELVLDNLGFGEFVDMDLTQAEELANQGVEPGDISVVEFTELSLEATSPSGSDLSFINSIELWVEAPDLEPVRAAWQDDFPVGQAHVDLNLDDVDLTPYVVSQSMTIRSDVSGSRPDDETTVEAAYRVRVGVTRKGCTNYVNGDN